MYNNCFTEKFISTKNSKSTNKIICGVIIPLVLAAIALIPTAEFLITVG